MKATHNAFVSVSSVRTMSIDSVVSPAQKNCLTQLCPTPTPRTFGNALMRSSNCSLVDGLPTWTALSHAKYPVQGGAQSLSMLNCPCYGHSRAAKGIQCAGERSQKRCPHPSHAAYAWPRHDHVSGMPEATACRALSLTIHRNTMSTVGEAYYLPWKFDSIYGKPQKSDVADGSCLQVPKQWTPPVLHHRAQARTSIRLTENTLIPSIWPSASPTNP